MEDIISNLIQTNDRDVSKIQKLFEMQDFDTLYDEYADVIEQLLFLEKKEEFEDFISEEGQLEMEPFLFAYAACQKVCLSIGIYEENVAELLRDFTEVGSDVELNNDAEKLVENITHINDFLRDTGRKYIVFLDETYCEGCYYVFAVDVTYDETWGGQLVERMKIMNFSQG